MNRNIGTIGKMSDDIYEPGDIYQDDPFFPKDQYNPGDPIDIFTPIDPDPRPILVYDEPGPKDNPILPAIDRTYNYKGVVMDSATGAGIPGATVTLTKTGQIVAQIAADYSGTFSIYTYVPGDVITISSAGYKKWSFPASEYQTKFELEKDQIILDPVLLPAGNQKNNILLYVGLGLLLLLATKKK